MIAVNLFDSNFGEHPGSTAYQTPEAVTYVRREMAWDGITVFTDQWMLNPVVDEVRSRVKVGWLREPYCLQPNTYEQHLRLRHKFDFTLTYDLAFLTAWPEAYRFCPYGGSWIGERDWGIPPKTRNCSMLVGTKMATEGHRMRRAAAERVATGGRVDLFGAMGTPVDYGPATKIRTLRDYRFSIMTETCYEPNLWTEWVGDALALGTVPVLWGCPNIGEFFNRQGFVLWRDAGELEAVVPYLTAEEYDRRWAAVAENQARMEEYRCTDDWIARRYWGGMA